MNVIYATCRCGHTGRITTPSAIKAHMGMRVFLLRCGRCGFGGPSTGFTVVLSFDAAVNPLLEQRCGEGDDEL